MAGEASLSAAKRALAEFEIRSAEQSRQRLQEQHDSGARWLLASLFAINAGSIMALLGSDKLDSGQLVGPLIVYLLGVFLCFMMAVAVQISDRKMIAAVHNWGQLWTTFIGTGELDDDTQNEAKARIFRAESVGRTGRFFGILSMLAWIIASGWVISLVVISSP